jgi:hypothetical protein
VAYVSTEPSTESGEDQNPEIGDSDRDLDDVETILVDTIDAIERIDPRRAQIIVEVSRSSVVNPPQTGPSATADLGAFSAHGPTIGPQGHILVVCTE